MKLLCKKRINQYIVENEYYLAFKYTNKSNINPYDWIIPIKDDRNDWYYNYSFTELEINYFFYTIQELRKQKLQHIKDLSIKDEI